MTESEIAAMIELQIAEVEFARCHAITGHGPGVPNRVAELERRGAVTRDHLSWLSRENAILRHQLEAMTAERDQALLRMPKAFPANVLRVRHG